MSDELTAHQTNAELLRAAMRHVGAPEFLFELVANELDKVEGDPSFHEVTLLGEVFNTFVITSDEASEVTAQLESQYDIARAIEGRLRVYLERFQAHGLQLDAVKTSLILHDYPSGEYAIWVNAPDKRSLTMVPSQFGGLQVYAVATSAQ